MMKPRVMNRLTRTFVLAGLAGVLLILSGCDTLEDAGETVILTREATFRFEFNTTSTQASQQVNSVGRVDLGGDLNNFDKSEILAATVTDVVVERLQPVGENLSDLMDSISLQLEASGASAPMVAQLSPLPDNREASLALTSNTSITNHVKAPNFGARLSLTNVAPDNYVLEVRVQIRLEMEGI